uniref:Uncharacterized protein n=1 Tax=Physcomitrium patens TaxID=3218 RepID=A0A2K1KE07_PHYPA|nr:hypothetical protein PHYPA_008387 [Physcomitrium patens]
MRFKNGPRLGTGTPRPCAVPFSTVPVRHTEQQLSINAFILPFHTLTANARCHTSQRKPASFRACCLSQTLSHSSLNVCGRVPVHFDITTFSTTCFRSKSCWPSCAM